MRFDTAVRIGGALAILLGIFEHSGAAAAQQKAAPTRLRIQEYPGTVLNLATWVAIDGGFCTRHDLSCETLSTPSGPLGLQAAAAGSIEILWTSTDVSMAAASRGNAVEAIVGLAPENIYTLSVRADIPLPHKAEGYPAVMHDLKGMRFGITGRGASTEIAVRALLLGAGMTADDVTFVSVGSPATAYPAMVEKQIDAALMFEPFQTLCAAQKTCVTAVAPAKGEGPPELRRLNGAFLVYVASKSFVAAHGKAIDDFIATMTETIAWMQQPANADAVLAIARKHLSLGDVPNADAILTQLVKTTIPTYGVKIDRGAIAAFSDFLLKFKQSETAVTPAEFVYSKAP